MGARAAGLTDAEINGVLFTLDVNRDVVTTRAIRQLLQDVAYHKAIVEKLRAERDESRGAQPMANPTTDDKRLAAIAACRLCVSDVFHKLADWMETLS